MTDQTEGSPPGEPTHPRREEVAFDLDRTLSAVVALRSQIPDDALTAQALGTRREGHGIVIRDDGLIVTIGYLVTEAESIWVVDNAGTPSAAYLVGFDQETGFGLAKAIAPLAATPLPMGSAAPLREGDPVIVAGHGGASGAINASVVAKREFAGYWEYVLDEALFTAPAHPSWGGTALLDLDGRLCGVGSLLVQQASELGDAADSGNMIVPIDLLPPILDDLQSFGRRSTPARPWLGCLVYEMRGHLVIAGVYEDCPADDADVRPGDIVVAVAGHSVTELAEMFRSVWRLGDAGVAVPLTLVREGRQLDVTVRSRDRHDCLKGGTLH